MSKVDEAPAASHPRVAVDVLQRDQRAILFAGDTDRTPAIDPLSDGFESQRALINWWQAAAVRTFGHLRSVLPARQLRRDDALRRALTTDAPDRAQTHTRQRLLEHTIEACHEAYRDLETRATEWLADSNDADTDWTQIDPTEQRHVAMRPAFSRLDTEQARALRTLWGGFESREAVMRWVHALPAVADFSGVLAADRGLPTQLARDDHALQQLTAESDAAEAWREQFAATVLLPAFGARATKLRAGERAEAKRTERTVPHG